MSSLNYALQYVGLERSEMEDTFEKAIRSCSTLSTLWGKADKDDNVKGAMQGSIEPVKVEPW